MKTLLVPVPDGASAHVSLDAAFQIAGRFCSHVTALHVRSDPTMAVPLVGEGMSGSMVEEMMSLAERQAGERAGAARKAFDEALARFGAVVAMAPPVAAEPQVVSAEWIDLVGREEEQVAWRGRLADLVVVARPEDGSEMPSLMTLNAGLMESGRPLLLAPPVPHPFGDRIAVAWNGSAEAGRAVSAALPLMRQASNVIILSIAEDERTTSATAGDLAAYLAWHRINAECRLVSPEGGNVAAALLREVDAQGADMLVMGAYTHSRLRQLILGGVTRHVLHHANISCLLCH